MGKFEGIEIICYRLLLVLLNGNVRLFQHLTVL